MLRKFTSIVLITFALVFTVAAQKTVVNDSKAKAMLLGRHKLALQWISWDYFGVANVTQKGGAFFLKGEQKKRGGTDYLKVDGRITQIDAREFKFDGTIETQVSFLNNGEPCKREGEMTFRITGKRKYWRLMEINNPCDEAADYVDIFFR